jgi:hypothetical protein
MEYALLLAAQPDVFVCVSVDMCVYAIANVNSGVRERDGIC